MAKEKELKDNADENKREFDHKQNSQMQRMKADEVNVGMKMRFIHNFT